MNSMIFPYSTEVAFRQAPVHIPWPALFQGACDVPDAGVACLPESEQKHGCKEEVMPTFSPTPTANSALLCPALPSAKQLIFLLPDTPAAQVQVTAQAWLCCLPFLCFLLCPSFSVYKL